MTQVMEEVSTDWAKQWCAENHDAMVAYIVKHYPNLPVGKVEAMIDHLWTRLVNRIVKDFGRTLEEAERAQARGLAFLVRRSSTGEGPSSPDEEEDLGWHTFMWYTLEFEAAGHVLTGRPIHHLPNDVPGWPQASDHDGVQAAARGCRRCDLDGGGKPCGDLLCTHI